MKLNREGVQLNAEERNKRNQNWATLEDEVSQFESATTDFNKTTNLLNGEITGLKAETAVQKNGLIATNKRVDNVVIEAGTAAYEKVVDASKLIWKEPVVAFSNLTTAYPQPQNGWAAQTTSDGAVYRYDGSTWKKIQQVDAGPVNALDTRLTAQLAETEMEVIKSKDSLRNNLTVASEKKVPVVTFLDDDIRTGVYTRLKPIFESRGVPMSVAAISGRLEDPAHLNVEQLHELQDLGWEIMGHTNTHPTGTNGLQQYMNDYARLEFEIGSGCKDVLVAKGFNVDGFVYPQGGHSYDIREVTKKHYSYSFAGVGINDTALMDSMVIKRIAFGLSAEFNPPINGNDEKNTLAYYKACVDYAVANNAWLVFMTHVNAHSLEEDVILGQLIDYIKSIDVPVLTARDGYKIHGNRYFAGDVEANNYFIINKDNKVLNSESGLKMSEITYNSKTLADTIDTYAEKTITFMRVTNSHASANGFPSGVGGYLVTYKLHESNALYNRQEYWPLTNPDTYTRHLSGSNNTWSEFFVNINSRNISGYNPTKKSRLAVPAITVPANSTIDVSVPLSGLSASNAHLSVTPTWGLDPGIMFNALILANDQATIRVHNLTTAEKVITARNWVFAYMT